MGFSDLKELKKRGNQVFLWLVIWLLIGIFISAFFEGYAVFILTPLISLCVVLFILSIFVDLRKMTFALFIVIIIITIALGTLFFIFHQIITFFFSIAIISYILITGIFSLYAVYEAGGSVDEFIYTKFPKTLNQITRIIEFLGGVLLGFLIVYLVYIFTGGQLYLVTWIFLITIFALAGLGLLFLLTKKFNAWIGTFSIVGSVFFVYLVISILFGPAIFGDGAYPLVIKLILAIADVIILFYTIGSIIARAEIISNKLKIKAETILMWLLFSKAAYELAKILNPLLITVKNRWVLLIFAVLFGIVGVIGIFSYSGYRRKKN